MRWRPMCGALLLLPCMAGAELLAPQMEARVQPPKVRLGEPFSLVLKVSRRSAQEKLALKPPAEWGAFELLSQKQTPDSHAPLSTEFQITLSAFELGVISVPKFELQVTSGDEHKSFEAPSAEIEVIASPNSEKPGKLQDIKGPEEVFVRSYRRLFVLAGALAAAALLYAFFRWKRATVKPALMGPPLPLEVRTFRSLEALSAMNLPSSGRAREFYFRLSEILRGYLGERFGFEALECTGTELLAALEQKSTPGLSKDGLRQFVEHSDQVKFARRDASDSECRQSLDFAFDVVRQTTPPPAPAHAGSPLS